MLRARWVARRSATARRQRSAPRARGPSAAQAGAAAARRSEQPQPAGDGRQLELALFTPLGDSRKLTIVQCSMCGMPVGVMDPAIGPQIGAEEPDRGDRRAAQPHCEGAAGLKADVYQHSGQARPLVRGYRAKLEPVKLLAGMVGDFKLPIGVGLHSAQNTRHQIDARRACQADRRPNLNRSTVHVPAHHAASNCARICRARHHLAR
jgi:hypothetical protein